jgi:hypothetical protein
MFVSRLSFEFPVPDSLRTHDERYWRMLAMPTNLPWYIATFRPPGGGALVQSMCFCWETDLLDVVQRVQVNDLRSLQMVRPTGPEQSGWSLSAIVRIWRLLESSSSDRPFLVFEDEQRACLCPLSGAELVSDFGDREVAAELKGPR